MPFHELINLRFFETKDNEPFESLLLAHTYPWECLAEIGQFIVDHGPTLPSASYTKLKDNVWVAVSAKIADTATIQGPAIIGENVEIRPGAFIRKNAYIGRGSVIGTATEVKNALIFGDVELPHYNYVGDSILSYGTHFGAGAITSNLRSDKKNIVIRYKGEQLETGLRKIGAITGEHVEIGCNAVMGPGTCVGKDCLIYPLTFVRFSLPAHSILTNHGELRTRK